MPLMSAKASIIYLVVSLALLSIGQPLIQTQLDQMSWDWSMAQIHMTRADIWSLGTSYHTDAANLILASPNSESKEMEFLYHYHRAKAHQNMRFRLFLLYASLNDRMPDSSLVDTWGKMTLEQLEEEIEAPYFLEHDISKKKREQTRFWRAIRYLVYGVAVLLYTVGMIGINIKRKKPKK